MIKNTEKEKFKSKESMKDDFNVDIIWMKWNDKKEEASKDVMNVDIIGLKVNENDDKDGQICDMMGNVIEIINHHKDDIEQDSKVYEGSLMGHYYSVVQVYKRHFKDNGTINT